MKKEKLIKKPAPIKPKDNWKNTEIGTGWGIVKFFWKLLSK